MKLLDDASPFYIRYTHVGIEHITNYCNSILNSIDIKDIKKFKHIRLESTHADYLLSIIPVARVIEFNPQRVSLFITIPGMDYRAHKDGLDCRYGINYPIRVLDNKCLTNWYADEDMREYSIDNLSGENKSRECVGFDKAKHVPIKTTVAQQNECILFNTDIFHSWDNSNSSNERVVLTLRPSGKFKSNNYYFDDIKQLIFKSLM